MNAYLQQEHQRMGKLYDVVMEEMDRVGSLIPDKSKYRGVINSWDGKRDENPVVDFYASLVGMATDLRNARDSLGKRIAFEETCDSANRYEANRKEGQIGLFSYLTSWDPIDILNLTELRFAFSR